MAPRVALLSCVKSKGTSPCAAEDMYVSDLFRSMRQYAERFAKEWFILSAEHGLLKRRQVIAPYERKLKTMPKLERIAWAAMVQKQLLDVLPPAAVVVILAGERYRENIAPFLQARGFRIEIPMLGLKFGEQLRWLKEQTR